MKNVLFALLLGYSSGALAIPGVGLVPTENAPTEEGVTIRVDEQTGAAEIADGDKWIPLNAVPVAEAEATIEKAQYYGYSNPCGQVYADPCAQVAPCMNCVPPPAVVDPCATVTCGQAYPYYVVPNRPYVYTAPPVVRPYVDPYPPTYYQPQYQPQYRPYYVAPRARNYYRGRTYYNYAYPQRYPRVIRRRY